MRLRDSIDGLMPDDYLLPYGTPLTLKDFKPLPDAAGWEIEALDADKHPRHFEISYLDFSEMSEREIDDLCATATADGDPITWRDPASRRKSDQAPLADWVDFILAQDAEARNVTEQKEWSGGDLSDSLHRIEHQVWAKDADEENLDNFDSIAEFQEWLDKRLRGTTVKATAFEIEDTDRPFTDKESKVLLVLRHWHPNPKPPIGVVPDGSEVREPDQYCLCWFHTDYQPDTWLTLEKKIPPEPTFSVATEGSQIISYCSDFVVPLAELRELYQLIPATSNVVDSIPRTPKRRWWGLMVEPIQLAMVFPSSGWNVIVRQEFDGWVVLFDAARTDVRAAINDAEGTFQREWGRWLDPNVALTDTELAAGVRKAEALLTSGSGGVK